MNAQTPMRLVILVLSGLAAIALIGAITLEAIRGAAPNELYMLASGSVAALGALLASPRSGVDTRHEDPVQVTVANPPSDPVPVETAT